MYKRFLNNADYLGIVTEEALGQLIRDKEIRLAQAEEAAEESILEYLTENYMVEEALEVGKNLAEYNRQITYPVGAHFYHDGKIYKTIRTINGYKAPANLEYWMEFNGLIQDEEVVPFYTQRGSYMPGDIVRFANTFFQCIEYNGIDYDNVRAPGVNGWEKVEAAPWIVNMTYMPWEVVSYNGLFYTLISQENTDWNTNPHDNDNWGLIGSYDPSINTYELSSTEYVEYNGEVFYPVINPNADELKENFNIILHDPRNGNLKKHILRIAVYELHKLISPNNVSQARITDYETSIIWLRDASRLKINPQIPRKLGPDKKPVSDIVVSTFMRSYDPNQNPWQI